MKKTFGVVGDDKRAAELVRLLRRDGYAVSAYGANLSDDEKRGLMPANQDNGVTLTDDANGANGVTLENNLESALNADAVILPVPLCKPDGTLNCSGAELPVTEMLSGFRQNQTVFAGLIPPEIARQARETGLSLIDYMKHEPMAIANAAATADAALAVTLEETREPLTGKRCLILGFGRIGKLMCQRLRGVGADVTAAARNPDDRAWIRAFGLSALDTAELAGCLSGFQMVCNTIPAPVLDADALRELPPDCFLLDLASSPGMDGDAAARFGLRFVWARGLPGRIVPRGAAAILRDTALHFLKE